MKIKLTEELWKEGNMYVSYCPELDITSCGESIEQAKKNLKEVILIHVEETQKMGTFMLIIRVVFIKRFVNYAIRDLLRAAS